MTLSLDSSRASACSIVDVLAPQSHDDPYPNPFRYVYCLHSSPSETELPVESGKVITNTTESQTTPIGFGTQASSSYRLQAGRSSALSTSAISSSSSSTIPSSSTS